LRPHQGLGHGEGGEQREEERGTSIWRDFHSVWCLHAAMQDASTQTQHFEGRPGQEGEPFAGMAHSPSPLAG